MPSRSSAPQEIGSGNRCGSTFRDVVAAWTIAVVAIVALATLA